MAKADQRDEELRAADGRVPGRRGRETRQKLLAQTAAQLGSNSYRDLKVIDIARDAGTSPATFYQYFGDVETAVLALAEDLVHQGDDLAASVRDAPWDPKAASASATAVVDAVLEFWARNQSVLRVVDLATAEGDQRFRALRTQLLNPVTNAMSEVVTDQKAAKRLPADIDPMAQAGVLVSMLVHVAEHVAGLEAWGVKHDDLRRSLARQLSWGLTGLKSG